MNDVPANQKKGIRPLWPMIVSPIVAGFFAVLYAASFVSDVPRSSGSVVSEGPFLLIFFIVTFVIYFFVIWSPIFGFMLLLCAVMSFRRPQSLLAWTISLAIFASSLVAFYYCLRELRFSPPMRKYPPFSYLQ
jgi:hypothetical protein